MYLHVLTVLDFLQYLVLFDSHLCYLPGFQDEYTLLHFVTWCGVILSRLLCLVKVATFSNYLHDCFLA